LRSRILSPTVIAAVRSPLTWRHRFMVGITDLSGPGSQDSPKKSSSTLRVEPCRKLPAMNEWTGERSAFLRAPRRQPCQLEWRFTRSTAPTLA
jgi:hypothetical protein